MFQKARLKLTAWYLLIITFICIFLSGVIFRIQMAEVKRFAQVQNMRFERQLPEGILPPNRPPEIDSDLVAETSNRLLINLLILNGVIIVISGGLGFVLAGKTLRPIKDMVDEQDRFISDSSHELRTPLTSLKSAMEVALMDKNLTLSEAKALISENIKDVNALQKLSDSLILLSRKGIVKSLNYQPITTKLVIGDSIRQLKSQATKKKITIKALIKNIKFIADKEKITNLLVILLDNAIKYSYSNTKVTVKAWKKDHFVIFSIKDKGVEISEKDMPHIFDRFYRADTSRSKIKTSGFGLGLSIAKMIVSEHHGTINAKSDEQGTAFTVKIPLKNS